MRQQFVTLALLLGGLSACGGSEADAILAERYSFLGPPMVTHLTPEQIRERIPYERIEIEYFDTWLWGGDKITLASDGLSQMKDRAGSWSCSLSIWEFARLCRLLESEGLESLEPSYESKGVFDATTITVRAWRSGEAAPIEVKDYGYEAPVALKAIQSAINGTARTAHWKPAPSATASPAPAADPAAPDQR